MTGPVTSSVSGTIEIPMLISALLLPLMQQAPVLGMKVSCVWSKHWGLRSKKKGKMVLDYLILMTSFFKRLSVQDNVTHVHSRDGQSVFQTGF